MLSRLILYCPFCEFESNVDMHDVEKGQTIACSSCTRKFNIYTIYRSFYEDIPLAKRIADIKSMLVYSKYSVGGTNEDEITAINDFLNANTFQKILSRIILQCLVYGNSVLEVDKQHRKLKLHDLADCEVKTGWLKKNGSKVADKVINIKTKQGCKISHANLVNFSMHGVHSPFGISVYGFWFDIWYVLQLSPKALINASILRHMGRDKIGLNQIQGIKKYFEDQVKLGAGLPPVLFQRNAQIDRMQLGMSFQFLKFDTDNRRREIASKVEREIFPLVLDKPWNRDFPKFKIEGHI